MAAVAQLGTDCTLYTGNTGTPKCPYVPNAWYIWILIPRDTIITASQLTTFNTTLAAGIANNDPLKRWYPIGPFVGIEDKTSEAKETSYPNGENHWASNGKYAFRGQYIDGGMSMHNQLSLFNGQHSRFDVLLVDVTNNGFVCVNQRNGTVKGLRLGNLFAPNMKINTFGEDAKFFCEIGLKDETQIDKQYAFVKMNNSYSIQDLAVGLIPTSVNVTTQLVASTKTVVVQVFSGDTNLGDYFSTELAATAIWNFTRDSTGVTNAASAVTYSAATKSFTIVGTTASGYFNASESYTLKLGTVSALVTAGITGYANSEGSTIAT